MKIKKREVINMAVAFSATLLILLVIYAIKGIYPFGSGNIFGGDLYQLYVPTYYHLYDSFHGASFFNDYTTAGVVGRNMLKSVFQPSTWFLMLLKRNQIINAMNIFLIVKLLVVSVAASFSFSKLFKKLPVHWTVLITLLYTFSGYNLEYYTNISWLDTVALYPLLILALVKMCEGRTKLPYILILTYLLALSTYMAFFCVVSIVVFFGLYVFIALDDSKRKKYIYNLGVGTFISLISSAYPIYSFVTGMTSSARYEKYSNGGTSPTTSTLSSFKNIVGSGFQKDIIAIILFLGLELAAACLIMLIIKSTKEKKYRRIAAFFSVSAALLILQLICRGTELLWHGGSRIMFPFRNGFIIAFLACILIAYYATHFMLGKAEKQKGSVLKNVLPFTVALIFGAGAALYSNKFYEITKAFNVTSLTGEQDKYFKPAIALFVLITLTYVGLLFIKNKRASSAVVMLCVISLTCVNAFGFIGNAEGSYRAESFNKYFSDCNEVGEVYGGKNQEFDLIRNPDISLITNYSYIADTHSVSNWVNILTQSQIRPYNNLGYSTVYTRTLDCGATAFSEALLRTTNSVSKKELNERLYTKTGTTKSGFNCYDNNYVLPFGVCFNDSILNIDTVNIKNTFAYQNDIYSAINGDGRLFEWVVPKTEKLEKTDLREYVIKNNWKNMPKRAGTVYTGTAKLELQKDSTLYFIAKNSYSKVMSLRVNGKLLTFPQNAENPGREYNTYFPSGYNCNIGEIGSFEKGVVEFNFSLLDGTMNDLIIYSMDNSKLAALCENTPETEYEVKGDTVYVNVNCNKDGYMFFPISYSTRRGISVNGTAVPMARVLGNFTAVKVSKGKNEIVIKNPTKAAKRSTLLVFLSFAMAASLAYIESLIKRRPKWLETVMQYAYGLLVSAALSVLYIVPVLSGLTAAIIRIIKKG